MFAGAGRVLDQAASLHRDRERGQSSLFGDEGQSRRGGGGAARCRAAPAWSSRERSAKEKEVLGFYFSEHPLEPLRGRARAARHPRGRATLLQQPHGTEVRVGGLDRRGAHDQHPDRQADGRGDARGPDRAHRVHDVPGPVRERARLAGRGRDRGGRRGGSRSATTAGAKLLLTEVRRLEDAPRGLGAVPAHRGAGRGALGGVAGGGGRGAVVPPGRLRGLPAHRACPTTRARRCARGGIAWPRTSAVADALRDRFPGLRAFWGKGAS